jgi:hypothetical protein
MGKRKERQSSAACSDDRGAPAINRHDDDEVNKTSPREPLNAAAAVSAAVPAAAAASAAAGLPASEAEENERTRPEASSDSRKKRRKDKEKKRRKDDRVACASTGTHTSPDAPGTRIADEGEEPEPSDATKASGTFVTTVQVHCGCVEG